MIQQWQRYGLYLLALAVTTGIIWYWNRGAQHRRFNRAFPSHPHPTWTDKDKDFLKVFEDAFRLRKHMAQRLSPETTPMQVYLTLYPEHCIYDDSETTRLLARLQQRLGPLPEDILSYSLRELATRWHA